MFDDDDLDDSALTSAAPSDTEVALQCLWAQCPAGARVAGGTIAAALCSQVYGIVRDRTQVDRDLERLRLSGTLRILQLPASPDERLLVDAAAYRGGLSSSVADGPARNAALEPSAALTVDAELGGPAIDALVAAGWCVPTRPVRAGPDEAPAEPSWLWSVPQCGRLWCGLLAARRDVLRALGRHRLGATQRLVVARGVARKLRDARLDMRFVERDMVGREWLTVDEHPTGANLALTTVGRAEAASAAATGKRKR